MHAVITERRIKNAKELLLNTSLTHSDIAKITGFGTRAKLIYAFKKQENRTPADYRKRERELLWIGHDEGYGHHINSTTKKSGGA